MSFKEEINKEIGELKSNIPDVEINAKLMLDSWVTPEDFAKINGTKDISVEKADKKIDETQIEDLTEQLIKAENVKRYMNLTEINSDVIQHFDNDTVKDLFPNEDIASKDNSDIMAMLHRLANEEKNANAQNMLGVCYISGMGVEISEETALRFFENAAEQNHPSAQRNLAIMLENQASTDKNRIIELYEKSAAQNDGYALNNLAACYLTGDGVKQNVKEAVKLFDKAVKVGDDYAMVNLADCYSVGNGVKRDDKKAYELYEQAAKQKNQDGLINAAECLFIGKGTKQDLKKAMEYFKIAADMGNETAQKRLDEIQEKMTPKKHEEVTAEKKDKAKKPSLDDSFGFFKTAADSKNNEATAKDGIEKSIEAPSKPISKGDR